MKQRKAFTMIELIVVVSIIAVLTVTAIVSYLSAQSNSRDSRRRADVQAIASAHQILYQDTKKWFIAGSGANSLGIGWFNYEGDIYLKSIAHALEEGKYLISAPRDPQISNDSTKCNAGACQYMVYQCSLIENKITVYAKLESPSAEESIQVATGCSYSSGPTANGMNFAVTVGQ